MSTTEKPPSGSWSTPLRLVRLVTDEDVLTIVADEEPFNQLKDAEHLEDATLFVALRRVDLAALGGKGAAYRLRITGVGAQG